MGDEVRTMRQRVIAEVAGAVFLVDAGDETAVEFVGSRRGSPRRWWGWKTASWTKGTSGRPAIVQAPELVGRSDAFGFVDPEVDSVERKVFGVEVIRGRAVIDGFAEEHGFLGAVVFGVVIVVGGQVGEILYRGVKFKHLGRAKIWSEDLPACGFAYLLLRCVAPCHYHRFGHPGSARYSL